MRSDLRVLYISGKRGVESPLLQYLARHDRRVSFVTFKLHSRSMSVRNYFRTLSLVFKSIKQFNPTIVLLEGPGMSNIALILIKYLYQIPLALRIKGDLWIGYSEIAQSIGLREKIRKFLNFRAAALLVQSADLIMPISKNITEIVRKKVGDRKNVRTVNIPFKVNLTESPGRLDSLEGKKYILTVTNFNFWEKVEPLAEAVKEYSASLRKRGLEWIILGDGFFLEKFRRNILEQLDRGEVTLMGRQDPVPFYKEASALFYISGMDGLPNVILEASLFCLPIIINNDCPAVEFVEDGCNGIVADFRNRERIDNLIGDIAAGKDYLRAIGENAREYAINNFSVERVSRDLEAALKECLALWSHPGLPPNYK